MRRADRLFQIVQRLRRRNVVVTATQLIAHARVSQNTFAERPGRGLRDLFEFYRRETASTPRPRDE